VEVGVSVNRRGRGRNYFGGGLGIFCQPVFFKVGKLTIWKPYLLVPIPAGGKPSWQEILGFRGPKPPSVYRTVSSLFPSLLFNYYLWIRQFWCKSIESLSLIWRPFTPVDRERNKFSQFHFSSWHNLLLLIRVLHPLTSEILSRRPNPSREGDGKRRILA